MAAKRKVAIAEDGSFLFSLPYVAELFGTVPRKVEQLIGAGVLDAA